MLVWNISVKFIASPFSSERPKINNLVKYISGYIDEVDYYEDYDESYDILWLLNSEIYLSVYSQSITGPSIFVYSNFIMICNLSKLGYVLCGSKKGSNKSPYHILFDNILLVICNKLLYLFLIIASAFGFCS